jgi:hypothetical protein
MRCHGRKPLDCWLGEGQTALRGACVAIYGRGNQEKGAAITVRRFKLERPVNYWFKWSATVTQHVTGMSGTLTYRLYAEPDMSIKSPENELY